MIFFMKACSFLSGLAGIAFFIYGSVYYTIGFCVISVLTRHEARLLALENRNEVP